MQNSVKMNWLGHHIVLFLPGRRYVLNRAEMPYPWTTDATIRIRHPKSSYTWSDWTSQLDSDVPAYPDERCLFIFELSPSVITFHIFVHSMQTHAKMQQMQTDAHKVPHVTTMRRRMWSTKVLFFISHRGLRLHFWLHSRPVCQILNIMSVYRSLNITVI